MTIYLSDKLINDIENIVDKKYSAKEKSAMQKTIRGYFIQIHNEAVQSTMIATNKKQFIEPKFYDQ